MRITFIGHASILIEAGGVTILSDPWWRRPCFGAQWWNYPPARIEALEGRHIDYIYISHGHHDHFHPATLCQFDRDAKIIVSQATDLRAALVKLGFDVVEVAADQTYELAPGVTCRVMETLNQDTLMVVSDGGEVCLNLNDSLHSAPASVQSAFVRRLKAVYPEIDYVFCGYGVASHFPNCYEIPGKNRAATAARRQHYFNQQWAQLMDRLNPRYAFPFAADVVFFDEDLFWVNEPTHNCERPTNALLCPRSTINTCDISPGFVIENGQILHKVLREPISAEALRVTCAEEIARANRMAKVDDSDINAITGLLQNNLNACADYLGSYGSDYAFLVQFRNSPFGIAIEKRGQKICLRNEQQSQETTQYDLVYRTRASYLTKSLSVPYGDEVLFVGSGGTFVYSDPSRVKDNLHREFMHLLKYHDERLSPRPGAPLKYLYDARRCLKRLFGLDQPDLYDLRSWTVFGDTECGNVYSRSVENKPREGGFRIASR